MSLQSHLVLFFCFFFQLLSTVSDALGLIESEHVWIMIEFLLFFLLLLMLGSLNLNFAFVFIFWIYFLFFAHHHQKTRFKTNFTTTWGDISVLCHIRLNPSRRAVLSYFHHICPDDIYSNFSQNLRQSFGMAPRTDGTSSVSRSFLEKGIWHEKSKNEMRKTDTNNDARYGENSLKGLQ